MAHYQYLAFAYGHEGDTLAFCQHHELAHHVLSESFGSHSLVLWALAHGEQPTPMIAAAEESLSMNLHLYVMTNILPHVDRVGLARAQGSVRPDRPSRRRGHCMKIEIFNRRNLLGSKRWYFRIRQRNGQIVAQSEGYSRRIDAMDTAHHLKEALGKATVVDA
jgi:uncharacterized protein YegP (UPF0339 family)